MQWHWAVGVMLALIPVAASGQTLQPLNAKGCLDATEAGATVTVAGRLTEHLFAAPPNYASIAQGDAEEKAFILELPRRICFADGEFADGSEQFDRVHVSAVDEGLRRVLRASVGRDVVLMGEAMGSHTGHHHAPMVLFARSIRVR